MMMMMMMLMMMMTVRLCVVLVHYVDTQELVIVFCFVANQACTASTGVTDYIEPNNIYSQTQSATSLNFSSLNSTTKCFEPCCVTLNHS